MTQNVDSLSVFVKAVADVAKWSLNEVPKGPKEKYSGVVKALVESVKISDNNFCKVCGESMTFLMGQTKLTHTLVGIYVCSNGHEVKYRRSLNG